MGRVCHANSFAEHRCRNTGAVLKFSLFIYMSYISFKRKKILCLSTSLLVKASLTYSKTIPIIFLSLKMYLIHSELNLFELLGNVLYLGST